MTTREGLGYDDVIIVNGKNETFGFPGKIEDDPVLAFVIKGDRSIDYAEDRRLFYVAMTRTKNRVYMVAPEQNPSEFLLEIKHDYKNVVLKGEWNEEPPQNTSNKKVCPMCGYPMQFRYKNAYGLRLFMCTNEPEVCGFMTNEVKAGKLCIMKCDQCRNGYLIVKPAKNIGYFLGCTNYKADKTGCGNKIWKQQFYEMNGFAPDPVEEEPEKAVRNSVHTEEQNKSSKSAVKDMPIQPVILKRAGLREDILFKEHNLNDTVFLVLSCLNHISENYFYSVTMLTDILCGATSERITKYKLDKVDEYAALTEWERTDDTAIIYWLIENHYILRTKEQYPVLHPTSDGQRYSDIITIGQLKKLKAYLEK